MPSICTSLMNRIPPLKSNASPYVLATLLDPLLPSSDLGPVLPPLVNLRQSSSQTGRSSKS